MTATSDLPTIVHRAEPADALRVRAVRLASLVDSPGVFRTPLEEERAHPVEVWRERLADPDVPTFVAVRAGVDVGLAVGSPHLDVEGEAGLYGLWVAPEARRCGVATVLIDAVLAWARGGGYPRLRLRVADANAPAIATCAAHGFAPTRRAGALPAPHAHITQHELALDL